MPLTTSQDMSVYEGSAMKRDGSPGCDEPISTLKLSGRPFSGIVPPSGFIIGLGTFEFAPVYLLQQ
jgi:hypothetical protein